MSADLSHRYYRLKWHVTSGVSTVGPQPLTFRKGRVSQPAYRYPRFCTRSISVDEAEFNYPWRPNRCIYCESDTDGLQKSRLRNEHIIPAGIGGTLVLQGASCKACEKVIGRSESKMINGVFATPRAHVGIIRKTKYKLTVLVDGSREQEILVPMPEHPVMLMMAQLMPPGLSSGRTSQESGIGSLWTKGFQFDPAAFSADERRDGLSATFDALRFVHMLAKIAHSYMAAEVRLENVVSYLREFIRSDFHDDFDSLNPYFHIGGSPVIEPTSDALHEIGWTAMGYGRLIYVVVRIRLFAQLGAPTYHVVAGHLTNLLPFPGLTTKLFPG